MYKSLVGKIVVYNHMSRTAAEISSFSSFSPVAREKKRCCASSASSQAVQVISSSSYWPR